MAQACSIRSKHGMKGQGKTKAHVHDTYGHIKASRQVAGIVSVACVRATRHRRHSSALVHYER
eukprot:7333370-Prymnesium_polylepis.1